MRTFLIFVIAIVLMGIDDGIDRVADALDRAYPKPGDQEGHKP